MFLGIPCAFFTSIVLCAKLATRNNNPNLPPYFEAIASEIVNHLELPRSDKKLTKPSVYTLEDGFIEQDRYFMDDMRYERMKKKSPVLYRPQIVEKLLDKVEELLEENEEVGLMVKGPQGVGKSYSLVNLAQHLLASDKYIVTFIPDCANFEEWNNLYGFILASVGVDIDTVPIDFSGNNSEQYRRLIALVRAIDDILQRNGKQWVFIFDQINKIFDKDGCESKKDIKSLPLPFSMIRNVMKPRRIISIVSASANNEASYRENHEGFVEWEHPHNWERGEVNLLYPDNNLWDHDQVASETGYVPMYLERWVAAEDDKTTYFTVLDSEIGASLRKLRKECIKWETELDWQEIVYSEICCMLGMVTQSSPPLIDRKYSFLETVPNSKSTFFVRALFPYIIKQYIKFFFKDLENYVDESEYQLIEVCQNPDTTDDVCGRIFEKIVLRRLGKNGILLSELKQLLRTADQKKVFGDLVDGLQLVNGTTFLEGTTLPVFLGTRKGFLLVPLLPNFPAVDAILIVEEVAIAIQVHTTAKHKDVSDKLLQCLQKAKWLDAKGVEAVLLVYVSPNSRIAKEMKRRLNRKLKATASNTQSDKVIPVFCCLENLRSLNTLLWPRQ